MPEAENHTGGADAAPLPGATNDTWRTWLMTGVRRTPVDRRRIRGDHKGLKQMLLEGMGGSEDRPHAWKDFSGAMIRHAVDDAMRSLPRKDTQVVKLAYFGGYSNREIAEQIGMTEASVQRRLRRALSAISEHVQHGRDLSRRVVYAVMVWLGGRWVHDAIHPLGSVAAVAGAAVIIAAQPVSSVAPAPPGVQQAQSAAGPPAHVVAPIPSPTVPAATVKQPSAPSLQQPPAQLPMPLPSLPPLPSPPIKPPTL